MTKAELESRIEKKKKEIATKEKSIQKWIDGMNDEAKEIVAACEIPTVGKKSDIGVQAYDRFISYFRSHKDDPTVMRQDWEFNKGPNMEEAYRAYRSLADLKATLAKYETDLAKLVNFDNEEKIEVLWKFLQEWRKNAYEYFVGNVEYYHELQENEDSAFKEYQKTQEYKDLYEQFKSWYPEYIIDYRIQVQWRKDYYRNVDSITKTIYLSGGRHDDKRLNKILDQDVQNKYTNLVNQVTAKAGEIQDASGLYIDAKGDIAGKIVGSKATVRLWTTLSAIDSEYMCPHYRSYCNVAN